MLITPLPQGFGVEVSDFDLETGCDPDDISKLKQAFADYYLVVFRNASPITPERQVEITRWFGPVIVEGDNAWTVLDNAEPAGRFVLPFHSDITFVEFPLAGISLCPQELPVNRTSTTYVSNALAWRQLPEDLKRELEGRRAQHIFVSSDDIDLGIPVFEYWRPACLPHPQTGQPLLFVTEHHVERIEGVADERCAELLQELFAILYAPERRYEHFWRLGDLVIWDNLAIQHARTRTAEIAQGRRVMRRVQLGQIGFMEQVERLRRQAGCLPENSIRSQKC